MTKMKNKIYNYFELKDKIKTKKKTMGMKQIKLFKKDAV